MTPHRRADRRLAVTRRLAAVSRIAATADECPRGRALATRRLNHPNPAPNVPAAPVKLLVLAQVPPPVHGQSIMVRTLLEGLPRTAGLDLHHVDLRLSENHAAIGRWSVRKIIRTFRCTLAAIRAARRHRCDTLYYVPAPPGKRGALYRDCLILACCRPFFRHLVLHWHAPGLGAWLAAGATAPERGLARVCFGRPSLSLVLAEALREDAAFFQSARTAVVPNGIADPAPQAPSPAPENPTRFPTLFLGLCSEEKGLFRAAEAVLAANTRVAAPGDQPVFTLTAAGPFPDAATAVRFAALCQRHPQVLRHIGFADETRKATLFPAARCLLFPTHYPAEGMPLVVLEALAHDVPVVATRWRALPDLVPPDCGRLVPVGDADALVAALVDLHVRPPAPGVCRARFLAHGTQPAHLATLAAALQTLTADQPARR